MNAETLSSQQRRAYLDKVQARMDRWNAEIDRLDAAIREVRADTRIKYHDRMGTLKKKRDQVRQKLADMKAATGDAWEELKSGIDRVWKEIEDTIESTRTALKQSD